MLAFSYLLAKYFSCSSMFSKKDFAIISNFRYISRTNSMLRLKQFYNLGAWYGIAIPDNLRVYPTRQLGPISPPFPFV